MNRNKRAHILELCSEDAHNSWTFWQSDVKTETECKEIMQTIDDLVREKRLTTLQHRSDGTFIEVPFEIYRLEKEVRDSMFSSGTSIDAIYWFSATDEGKKEDYSHRNNSKH